jgi:hypothetical protein
MKNRKDLKLNKEEMHTITACAKALEKIALKYNNRVQMPPDRLKTIMKEIIAGNSVIASVIETPKFNCAADMSALAYASYLNGDIKDALRHQTVAWQFEDAPSFYSAVVQCNTEADVAEEDLGDDPDNVGIEEMSDDDLPDTELMDRDGSDADIDGENIEEDMLPEDDDEDDYFDENDEDMPMDMEADDEDSVPMDIEDDEDVIIPTRNGVAEVEQFEADGGEPQMNMGEPYQVPDDEYAYDKELNDAVDSVVATLNDEDMNDGEATGNDSNVNPIENINEDEEKEAKEKPSGSLIKGDPVMANVIKAIRKTPNGRAVLQAANHLSMDGKPKSKKRAELFLKRVYNLSVVD